MGKMFRAKLLFLISVVFITVVLGFSCRPANIVRADEISNPWADDNSNYFIDTAMNYLVSTDTGYCRVANTKIGILVEEYTDSFEFISRKSIETELDGFGCFYSGEDYYYIAFYGNNIEEDDDKEVIRVVKYSKDWERISAACLTGGSDDYSKSCFTFDTRHSQMEECNGKLYLVTGHEGYIDETIERRHQGLLVYEIDEASMTGYPLFYNLFHSFSQHIAIKDSDNIFLLECSEGMEATAISKFSQSEEGYTTIQVLKYGGQRTSSTAVATKAYTTGIACSDRNVLSVGTSIDQSKYNDDEYNYLYNAYLTVTPIDDFTEEATTLKWLGDFDSDGGMMDVRLVKINDDRFVIIWEKPIHEGAATNENILGEHIIHYVFVDGDGEIISDEMEAPVPVAYCDAVLKNGYVSWIASSVNFFEFVNMDAYTGNIDTVVFRVAGENATWNIEGDTLYIEGSGKIKSWFLADLDAESIKHIEIADGITEIGEDAFNGIQVESLVLPSSITTIEMHAFCNSGELKRIYIPDSVTEIGGGAFFTGAYYYRTDIPVYYVMIFCDEGSYAQQYAIDNNISYVISDDIDAQVYYVFTDVAEHGSVDVPNIYACPGRKVTVTVTPDPGYVFDYLIVNDEPVQSTTFIMPDEDVIVSAVFRDKNVSPTPTKKPTATPTPTKKPTVTPTPTIPDKPKSTWVQEGGNWYYYDANGVKVTGWQKIGNWYYFDNDGVMQTGWINDGGTWYYLRASGAMHTGWLSSGNKWYYLKPSGAMATGWEKVDGVWYYFSGSGAMVTGWQKIGGSWYYLQPSGAMKTGWLLSGGKWYFMYASGAMATGWVQSGKDWYYMDATGAMVTGWKTIGGFTYYFEESGRMVTGNQVIDGVRYMFDNDGHCKNPPA